MSKLSPQFEIVSVADGHGWQTVAGEMAYDSAHVYVENVRVLTPTRQDKPVAWTIVHRKAAVAIAPRLEDGRFLLVAQERIPVHRMMWEFPAGQIDVPASEVTRELVLNTAMNELREETGAALLPEGELQSLGYFFPSQGFTQEHVYLFLASPVRIVGEQSPAGGEQFGGIRCVTAHELTQMVANNEINTGPTLALYAKLSALGHLGVYCNPKEGSPGSV